MRYIFVSGGVVSGLGKGVISASLGFLLKSAGVAVTSVKVDMYLNLDAGTIRPQEHGEVFVTADGLETDQDLGNYERFLNTSLRRENYLTTGQVYKSVIERERSFGYNGEDVEAIPHVTDEIINRIKAAGKKNKAEVVIIELGGTVGEYQNILFFEANRILKLQNDDPVLHLHVSFLPLIKSLGELKSKPAQQSVRVLQGMGIQPDFLLARSEKEIDEKRRQKLALFCNLSTEDVITCPDVDSIYSVPDLLDKQKLTKKILKKLQLKSGPVKKYLRSWTKATTQPANGREVSIGIVAKYLKVGNFTLKDSYISVIEALNHAGTKLIKRIKIIWFDSENFDPAELSKVDGVLIPQGWGSRGVEGKIAAIKYARENKLPYLGLCFGMQMAVIEFARNVCGFKNANSSEVDNKTPHPVIHVMPEQEAYLKAHQYGGTIRLGSYPCLLKSGSLLAKLYKKYTKDKNTPWVKDSKIVKKKRAKETIFERHRHRYEFNNEYRKKLEEAGLVISGTSPDGRLVEAIEFNDHPFFLGTQYHPEYIGRPEAPHPIFLGFIKACSDPDKV